jgi:hypothetical protein
VLRLSDRLGLTGTQRQRGVRAASQYADGSVVVKCSDPPIVDGHRNCRTAPVDRLVLPARTNDRYRAGTAHFTLVSLHGERQDSCVACERLERVTAGPVL